MEFYHGIDRPEKANIKDRGGRLCGRARQRDRTARERMRHL